ncbi:MAG: DoxX-like family protein [Pseudomonadota bacterium]
MASLIVHGGAAVDIVLGLAIPVRPAARLAELGMASLSVAYLLGATVAMPWLWADPLGPLVKVIPGIVPALLVAGVIERR